MIQYKTIYVASKYVDKIVNELSELGWSLHTRDNVAYRNGLKTLGPFYSDVDRPLVELTLAFDDSLPGHNKELYELADEYLFYRDTLMRTIGTHIGGFVTGIVFGGILTLAGFITLLGGVVADFSSAITVGLIILGHGLPAIPLGIWGIKHRSKSNRIANAESKEKLEQIFFKAKQLSK